MTINMSWKEFHAWERGQQAKRANREQGKLAKATGDAWEQELALYHRQLEAAGLAVVDKTGPAVKWVGGGQVVVVAPGPCDYVATLRGGRAVHFEAKSTGTKQGFTLPAKSIHQKERLEQAQAMGAVAFYLVYWSRFDEAEVFTLDRVDGRRIRRGEGERIEGCRWLEWVTKVASNG